MMKRIPCMSAAILLSSCTCAIHYENWKNESKSRKITTEMIAEGMDDSGFKRKNVGPDSVEYKKRKSLVRFTERDQIISFHSSFCPLPWELLFGDDSFREIKKAERSLVASIQAHRVSLRKLSDEETGKLSQKGE